MTKLFGVLVLALLLSVHTSAQNLNEAKAQVQELRGVVRARISTGFSTVSNAIRDVMHYRNNMLDKARIDFRLEHQTLSGHLTALKELGEAASVDVTPCLDPQENLLAALPATLEDGLLECLIFANVEATVINNDARYFMDVIVNEVEFLDFQLDVCGESFLCFAPVLQKVELAIVDLPAKVGVEINKALDLADELKNMITECVEQKKSQMSTEGGNIVAESRECVNKLIP